MKRAVRTLARPPAIMLLPRHCPDCRVKGATPTRAGGLAPVEGAELREFAEEGSGRRRADPRHGGQEFLLLAPGGRAADGIVEVLVEAGELLLERLDEAADALDHAGRGARSRWRSALIMATIWRRRATRSAKSRFSSSGSGRIVGLVASRKRAMRAASMASVLARWPMATAKARTWPGLTSATGRPAAMRPAETTVSKPPEASIRPLGARGGRGGRRGRRCRRRRGGRRRPLRWGGCGRRGCSWRRRCRRGWCPSCPFLAPAGFVCGPSDCSGSMERRTETLASPRARSPQGAAVFGGRHRAGRLIGSGRSR